MYVLYIYTYINTFTNVLLQICVYTYKYVYIHINVCIYVYIYNITNKYDLGLSKARVPQNQQRLFPFLHSLRPQFEGCSPFMYKLTNEYFVGKFKSFFGQC